MPHSPYTAKIYAPIFCLDSFKQELRHAGSRMDLDDLNEHEEETIIEIGHVLVKQCEFLETKLKMKRDQNGQLIETIKGLKEESEGLAKENKKLKTENEELKGENGVQRREEVEAVNGLEGQVLERVTPRRSASNNDLAEVDSPTKALKSKKATSIAEPDLGIFAVRQRDQIPDAKKKKKSVKKGEKCKDIETQ